MSEASKNAEPPAKPSEAKPETGEGMHKVDQQVQEDAAEEREKSGGYD